MKIWRLIIVLSFFVFVIARTWPIRRQFLSNANLTNYDLRLVSQEQYWRKMSQSLQKLTANDERRLEAEEQLASVLALEHQYKLATELYQSIWQERMKKITDKYDPKVVRTLLAMAFLNMDLGFLEACEDCYKTAWDYDRARLSSGDPRITRDLNNLGVIYYLLAQSASNKLERQLQFERSNLFLIQALMSCHNKTRHDSEQEANILDNQFLALRDTERLQQAQASKQQAERLHYMIPGRFNAP